MFSALISALAATAALQSPAAAQFLAVTFDGDFLSIKPSGTASLAFSTGVQGLQGMTVGPNGRIWCIKRVGALPPALYQVDTVLGTAQSFHFTYLNDATGIATSPAGMLYATDLTGSSQSELFWIDPLDPNGSTAHWIGEIKIGNQFPNVLAITFSPSGTLYAWASHYGLMRVDPANAQAVDVDGSVGATEVLHGLALAPDGFLYGGYDNFYRVDPVSGAVALLGPLGFGGIRGLEPFSFSAPFVYCRPKVNSAGCYPAIAVQGSNSLSGPDDLSLFASGVLAQKPGLLIWSTVPQSIPFAGGTLCVSGTIRRTAAQLATGAQGCDGTYACDFTHAYMSSVGLQAGDTVHAQWWSRDPGFASPSNVGLTDAAVIPLLP